MGGEDFLQRLKDRLESRADRREIPALGHARRRPEISTILDCIARAYGCAKKDLLISRRRGNEARAVAMVIIWETCGMSLREIGELFGGAGYTAVAQMVARTKAKDDQNLLAFKLNKLKAKCEK